VAGHLVALGPRACTSQSTSSVWRTRLQPGRGNRGDERPEGRVQPRVLEALKELGEPVLRWKPAVVGLGDLDTSMVANEDIRARNGLLLLTKENRFPRQPGAAASFATEIGIIEPIQVLLPQGSRKPAESDVAAAS